MKLVTFTHQTTTRLGVISGDQVVDLAAASPNLPRDMNAFLGAGAEAMSTAARPKRMRARGCRSPTCGSRRR
jgi:hypothetical protein